MYFNILISPDRTKYMSSGSCCMCFCFATFDVYIDKEKKRPKKNEVRNLAERFDGNPKLIEKFVFQDEKEFTLKVQTKHSKT